MICELCKKQPATVHVTEIAWSGEKSQVLQKHMCEACASALELPSAPVVIAKAPPDIWKLLRQSAQKARAEGSLACPHCGMSLAEFRSKGRFGCPKDYEVFRAHIEPLLLRVHNARSHRGRLPGRDEGSRQRSQHLSELRSKLEAAIREEAYESAARLRDEIQELEAPPKAT
jgi:protein arginine kinase activator